MHIPVGVNNEPHKIDVQGACCMAFAYGKEITMKVTQLFRCYSADPKMDSYGRCAETGDCGPIDPGYILEETVDVSAGED